MDNPGVVLTPSEDDDKHYKQYLIKKLDQAELLIENIRKEALRMAEDVENIYNSVDAVRNSNSLHHLSEGKLKSVPINRFCLKMKIH